MATTYYKVSNGSINKIVGKDKVKNDREALDWINISATSREELAASFLDLDLYPEDPLLDLIQHPEEFPLSKIYDDFVVLNLQVSNESDIYKSDYMSVIIEENLILTLMPESGDFFDDKFLSTYSEKDYPTFRYFLFNLLLMKIISKNNENTRHVRKRLKKLESKLSNEPEELSSNILMQCERDINQFSDIIEDQSVAFELLASFNASHLDQEFVHKSKELVKGFTPLNKALERLEKKAESLRLQYMIMQQEESTKKINTLTIIQAIFVPLTFVAGVYGMNFVNIPELNWPLGYLFVWLLFIAMAGGLLIYFYKKGWFD